MHNQLDAKDADGRPLGEIRAASQAKEGVPMVLRACPYKDDRKGRPMNASALEQIAGDWKGVLEDVESFRFERRSRSRSDSEEHGDRGWWPLMECVVDQLTAPARFLLTQAPPFQPVPVRCAVGHKLAAGFFGVVRKIIEDEARGQKRAVTVEEFLDAVSEQKALLGVSEVCAGSPNMIRRATQTLLRELPRGDERPRDRGEDWGARVRVARVVSNQLALGMSLSLYDQQQERLFFERFQEGLEARNPFFGRRLRARAADVLSGAKLRHDAPLRALRTGDARGKMANWLERGVRTAGNDGSVSEVMECLRLLLDEQGGALLIPEGRHLHLAAHLEHYLTLLVSFVGRQWELEMVLRSSLGLAAETPLHLSAHQRPLLRALDWYEALLGLKISCVPAENPRVFLRALGKKRIVELPVARLCDPERSENELSA